MESGPGSLTGRQRQGLDTTAPRGERRPRLALAAALLVSCVLGSIHAFSVFIAPLEAEFQATRASVALLYSLALLSLTLAVLLSHRVFRRFAPQRILLALGTTACLGLLLAAGLQSLPVTALGFSLVFGFANGLGYALTLQLAAHAYPDSKGAAMGAVTAVYALGAMIFAKVFALLIVAAGPAPAFASLGAVILVLTAAGALAVRSSAIRFGPAADAASASAEGDDGRSLAILWVGYGCGCLAGLMIIGHAAAVVASAGGSPSDRVLGTMLIALGNAVGGVCAGLLADRVAARSLILGLPLLSGAALLTLAADLAPGQVIAALVVIGFAYGAIIAVYPVVTVAYFGLAQSARAYGRIFTAWGAAGLAGPFLAGVVYDGSGSYGKAALIAAGLAGVSAAAIVFLPRQALAA